ncbi:MAG: (2Fe-2S)-binding protein [Luteimonas sp.]
MYICICNGVTQDDIRQAAAAGCRSLPELTMRTGCGATCGTCLESAAQVLREAQQDAVGCIELQLLSNAA